MAISENEQTALNQLFAKHKGTYEGCKQDYFALQYLMKKFRCPVEEAAQRVSFGNHDYGIDAYHVDRDTKNLYLFQFKWSDNPNLFKESLDRLNDSGLDRIFGSSLGDSKANDLLNALRLDLREYRDLIERVYIQFIFKGSVEAIETNAGLSERKEVMANKEHLVHEFFGRKVDLIVEFLGDKRGGTEAPPEHTFRVAFSEKATVRNSQPEAVMHVGFVALKDVVAIYTVLGQKFLSRNIRAGLAPDNPPNRKIRQSLSEIVLRQTQPPEVFAILHNGISLAAERVVFSDGCATLTTPRLLNGAQTISSVAKFLDDNKNHPKLKDPDNALSKILVLARIIEHEPMGEFVTAVTIANNQQNPVLP